MGDVFVDQVLMIDLVRSSLPPGWVIYVKENYLQWREPNAMIGRFSGYYHEIAEMKDVFLIPAETATFELIEKSQAVASITGSACWEAILRGKPSLVFGYIWYMYCDGVFRVSDHESCKEAIKKIETGYKPDRQKILNYLAVMDRVSIPGFHAEGLRRAYKLDISWEKNMKNIARFLGKELSAN